MNSVHTKEKKRFVDASSKENQKAKNSITALKIEYELNFIG